MGMTTNLIYIAYAYQPLPIIIYLLFLPSGMQLIWAYPFINIAVVFDAHGSPVSRNHQEHSQSLAIR